MSKYTVTVVLGYGSLTKDHTVEAESFTIEGHSATFKNSTEVDGVVAHFNNVLVVIKLKD